MSERISIDEAIAKGRAVLATDGEVEDVVALLRNAGFDMMDSIKAVMAIQNVRLGEAKLLVHNSKAWSDVRSANEEMHRSLADHLEHEL